MRDYRNGVTLFPIQDALIKAIPWVVIASHEGQADTNHGQTLKGLADRMGLSPCEACAVIEGRKWQKMDAAFARVRLMQLVHEKEGQADV